MKDANACDRMDQIMAPLAQTPLFDSSRQRPPKAPALIAELPPTLAWSLIRLGRLVLLDVRTIEERRYVGHVPGSLHIAWATGTAMQRNPRFVGEVEAKLAKATPLALLCRSGKRAAEAAEALTDAGFQEVYSVQAGFEGNLNANQRRGTKDGWRFHGLPWLQD